MTDYQSGGGVSEREAERIWGFCERVAREYCGSYGYQQEPMKLARIIYDAMPEVPALRAARQDAGAQETQQTLLDDVIGILEGHDCKAAAKAVKAAKKHIPNMPIYRGDK